MLNIKDIQNNIEHAPEDLNVKAGHILLVGFVSTLLVKKYLLTGDVFWIFPACFFLGSMWFYSRVFVAHIREEQRRAELEDS